MGWESILQGGRKLLAFAPTPEAKALGDAQSSSCDKHGEGILLPHLESQLACPNEDCPVRCADPIAELE